MAASSLGFVLYLGLRGQARDPHTAARYFEMAADQVRLQRASEGGGGGSVCVYTEVCVCESTLSRPSSPPLSLPSWSWAFCECRATNRQQQRSVECWWRTAGWRPSRSAPTPSSAALQPVGRGGP